jgi:hypothetical protein
MDATVKLTRQGVRDLDFGSKKKPAAATQDVGTQAQPPVAPEPPVGSSVEVIEVGPPLSRPGVAPIAPR